MFKPCRPAWEGVPLAKWGVLAQAIMQKRVTSEASKDGTDPISYKFFLQGHVLQTLAFSPVPTGLLIQCYTTVACSGEGGGGLIYKVNKYFSEICLEMTLPSTTFHKIGI